MLKNRNEKSKMIVPAVCSSATGAILLGLLRLSLPVDLDSMSATEFLIAVFGQMETANIINTDLAARPGPDIRGEHSPSTSYTLSGRLV